MTAFADSSAIVKLYVEEEDTERVRAWPGPVLIAAISEVEVCAAIWRKQRLAEKLASHARLVVDSFRRDLESLGGDVELMRVALTPQILDRAAGLVGRHQLRAYDVVQLATAVVVREVAPVREFLAFDRELCRAAAGEGFDVPFEAAPVSP